MEIAIEPHDPRWALKFDRESRAVAGVLGPAMAAIHHIGSTSISTVHARPIIDMLVEVSTLHEIDTRSAGMAELGYEAMGEFGIPGRRYFRKNDDSGVREYQAHMFEAGSPEVERHLAFRDFISAHADLAKRYSDLKCCLARAHPRDIEAYMDGKDPLIKELERRALAWRSSCVL